MNKFLMICCFCTVALSGTSQNEPYKNPNLSASERAWDLLSRMTLEEKISQMTNNASEVERLGIPKYQWWNEALHGVARAGKATVFPQAIGLAATFDDQAVYETFVMVSDEARAKYHDFQRKGERDIYKGLTFWTPNINIFRDPRWGRGMETYGEDPFLTAQMGVSVVKGLQGDGQSKYDKVHACAKHYAVHSGPEWNRHSFDAKNISPRDLRETYLPAFKALVKDGNVKEVMCAYNRFEGEPCCSNKQLLIRILREEWGYDNVVVSDCGALGDFYHKNHHETHANAVSAAADAIVSGTDLECGKDSYPSLKVAVEKGLITEDKINESVFRLLRARFQLGMFDKDELVPWANLPYSIVESEKHRAKALEMARKSIVLLTNKNHTLPLSKSIRKVAVLGPNANDSVMLWANYNGFPTKSVTILEGIKSKLPEGTVYYDKACNLVNSEINYKEVAAKAAEADVIIFVGGLSSSLEGEEMSVDLPGFKRGDRTNIDLPQVQEKLLKELKATGKPVIFVVCSGSALALPWEAENLDAMLEAWYPGQEGGTAVADVLFGDYNPAGRLPITFYASTSDLPDFEDYNMANRTYRYFKGKPLFPFGYGLSYSTFVYGKAKIDKKILSAGEGLSLDIPLKNVGKYDGDEVVQVYLRNLNDPDGPVKTLRAFRRVTIEAGRKESVRIELPASTFECFNSSTEQMEVCQGKYELLYGGSSDEKDLQKLRITVK